MKELFRPLFRLLGHQNYLRFGARDRLIRLFETPESAPPYRFEVPFFGHTYVGSINNFIDWRTYYYGAYAYEELDLIRDFLQPVNKPILFDIGANIGHHTLFTSGLCEQVFAFEPFPAVAEKLKEKLRINHIENVELCPKGLGNNNTIEPFSPPGDANTGVGSFVGNDANTESIELEVITGDRFVAEADITKLDFVKMDIEGYETVALEGLESTLKRFRPVVLFEWSETQRGFSRHGARSELFPSRYKFFQFLSETPRYFIFREKSYRLISADNHWDDGYIVAVPEEYISMVNMVQPKPRIAANLKAE